eukprot:TRINITY_DN31629_c0_g1_i1.p1 TRINITY_DN31629_c0_g1~~TRINITY_DN31629_c0_g1_i1.p1  ORF type:complete len:479 (-),score=93.87 TRINITY_DN31629_c0_g1_i1:255-1691(-)
MGLVTRAIVFLSVAWLFLLWLRSASHPAWSWPCLVVGVSCPHGTVHYGHMEPAYHAVAESISRVVRQGGTEGAAAAAYKDGRLVVDIGAGRRLDGSPYTPSTIQAIHSAGKAFESVVIAMLVDRGLVEYHAPIATYWPEFGVNGKANVTLSQLLKHDGGLSYFMDRTKVYPADLANLPYLDAKLANMSHCHPDQPDDRYYSPTLRGLIFDAVVRRVDPRGRSISQFIREEVIVPLGLQDDWFLGMTEAEASSDRIDRFNPGGPSLAFSRLAAFFFDWTGLGSRVPPTSWRTIPMLLDANSVMRVGNEHGFNQNFDVVWDTVDTVYTNKFSSRAAPCSSSNMFANARVLSRVFAAVANGGRLDNVTLFSEETFKKSMVFDEVHANKLERYFLVNLTITDGGWWVFYPDYTDAICADGFCQADLSQPYPFFGQTGWGGTLLMFSPEWKLSMAFVVNTADGGFLPSRALSVFNTVFKANQE